MYTIARADTSGAQWDFHIGSPDFYITSEEMLDYGQGTYKAW